MEQNAGGHATRNLSRTGAVCVALSLCALLLSVSCRQQETPQHGPGVGPVESGICSPPARPPTRRLLPPDIRGCTRLEVEYAYSTLRHFFPNPAQQSVLSADELEYVKSLKTIPVDDPKTIEALTRDVATGRPFTPPAHAQFSSPPPIRFTCYKGDERVAVFTACGTIVVVGEGEWFHYDTFLLSTQFIPCQIRALVSRAKCADKLATLGIFVRGYIGHEGEDKTCLPCSEWCDALLQKRTPGMQEAIRKSWACHSAGERKCDFAMNADWDVNSPLDTVLLFEAKAGWNQCGGPELVTFDNHDPRGGLVLLNDGTVKFIRTAEELRQLRWN
jgi:hypothetical protein